MQELLVQCMDLFLGIRCKWRVLDYHNNLAVSRVFQAEAEYIHRAYCESEEMYLEEYDLVVSRLRR